MHCESSKNKEDAVWTRLDNDKYLSTVMTSIRVCVVTDHKYSYLFIQYIRNIAARDYGHILRRQIAARVGFK
jgi:hypothetical protein